MTEIELQSGKIKELTTLEAIAEHRQVGNYGSSSNRNQKEKKEDVSLMLQGQSKGLNNTPLIRAQGNNLPPTQPILNQNY